MQKDDKIKTGHTYFIKEINNPSAKIQEVTCTQVFDKTYKFTRPDKEILILEKSEISVKQIGIDGYRIIEDLGVVASLEEE